MQNRTILNDALVLVLLGGLALSVIAFFLPAKLSMLAAAFVGFFAGHAVFVRVTFWPLSESGKDLARAGVVICLSMFASLLLYLALSIVKVSYGMMAGLQVS